MKLNIITHRRWWYGISLAIIVPGMIALALGGLKRGIDFTGGSQLQVTGSVDPARLKSLADSLNLKDASITTVAGGQTIISFRDNGDHESALESQLAAMGNQKVQFDSVGGSVSRDITRNALLSVLVASIAIVLYIAYAFRNMPPPVKSWSFGLAAIIALLHDALVVIGVFAILGKFFNVEIDALFVTAVLTVIGFSVHDTIVVFDRIRENLRREHKPFDQVVNDSILETFARSINTSLTVILTLLALLLFGGTTIHNFVLALLVGIASGTYSSIFNASPLLVSWHQHQLKSAKR